MSDLLPAVWTALTLGLVAATQPGPFQAYLLSRTLRVGRAGALPLTLAPLISDGPIAALSLLVLAQAPSRVLSILGLAGGAVVWFLAIEAWRAWRAEATETANGDATASAQDRGGFLRAVIVNTLNPGPWTFWALILGPLVIEAGRTQPWNAVAVVTSFYLTLVGGLMALVLAFSAAAQLGYRVRRGLQLVSILGLVVFGSVLIVRGLTG